MTSTVSVAAAEVVLAVVAFNEFVTTQSYVPAPAAAAALLSDKVVVVAPATAEPLNRHAYVSVPFPVAAIVNVAGAPLAMISDAGCIVIVGAFADAGGGGG